MVMRVNLKVFGRYRSLPNSEHPESAWKYAVRFESFRPEQLFKVTEIKQL